MDGVNEKSEHLRKRLLALWETWDADLKFPEFLDFLEFLDEQLRAVYAQGAEYGYNQQLAGLPLDVGGYVADRYRKD